MDAGSFIMGFWVIWFLCGIVPAFCVLKTARAEVGITVGHLVFAACIVASGAVSACFGIVYWLIQHGDSVVIKKREATKTVSKPIIFPAPAPEQEVRETLYPDQHELGSWR